MATKSDIPAPYKFEVRQLTRLKAHPDQAEVRSITDEALKGLSGSIEKLGYLEEIIFNKRTGHIVSGHQRWEVLKRLGHKTANVKVIDVDRDVEDQIFFTLNNTAIGGAFTKDAKVKLHDLEVRLGQESFEAIGLDLLKVSFANIPDKLKSGNADEDDTPDLPKNAKSKPGDLYQLGDHRLFCGDSAVESDVNKAMGNEKALLMLTDPPYGVSKETTKYNPKAKRWSDIANDDKTGQELTDWLKSVIGIWVTKMDWRGAFYCWTAAMQEGTAARKALVESGVHVQSQIIWVKNSLVLGQADYQWRHENCWYGFFKGRKHHWYGGRAQTTVWEVKREFDNIHPTQKPVALFRIPIENHLTKGQLCCDPFVGSGTTIIACEQLGRRCFAMEIEPLYVDVSVQRWENFTGRKAKKLKV